MDRMAAVEGLSFLIGLILVILFLVPFGIYGYSIFKEGNKLDASISFLAEDISKLNSGETRSLLLYTGRPNDLTLIGFDTGNNDFGNDGIWDCSHVSTHLSFFGKIKKPIQCGNKPCVCFCSIGSANFQGACESSSARCAVIDVNYQLKFAGSETECEYGPFISSSSEINKLKLQRHESLVGVCLSGECINLDRQAAIDKFNQFIESYKQCISSENNKCLCDSFDASSLPEGYKVRISSSNGVTKIGLLSQEKRLYTETLNDNYLCKYSGSDDTSDIPQLEFSKDNPSDYADGNLLNFYKKSAQVACVAEKKGNSFDYLRNLRSCSQETPARDGSVSLT